MAARRRKASQLAAKRWSRLQFPGFADRFRPFDGPHGAKRSGIVTVLRYNPNQCHTRIGTVFGVL